MPLQIEKKIVVVQIAPAVRAAWGEAMGMKREDATVGKILALPGSAWESDYVFDTSFSADLTIMEEATEFLERFQNGSLNNWPMFTSCCPGWVRFVKAQYPGNGAAAFYREISAADVWRGYEDLLRAIHWRGS